MDVADRLPVRYQGLSAGMVRFSAVWVAMGLLIATFLGKMTLYFC